MERNCSGVLVRKYQHTPERETPVPSFRRTIVSTMNRIESLALGLQYAYEHHVMHEHHAIHAKCQQCQSYYIKVHRWTGTNCCHLSPSNWLPRASHMSAARSLSVCR
jgi:hypothetical protein